MEELEGPPGVRELRTRWIVSNWTCLCASRPLSNQAAVISPSYPCLEHPLHWMQLSIFLGVRGLDLICSFAGNLCDQACPWLWLWLWQGDPSSRDLSPCTAPVLGSPSSPPRGPSWHWTFVCKHLVPICGNGFPKARIVRSPAHLGIHQDCRFLALDSQGDHLSLQSKQS